jgi:ApbE superfamily uncharacterized protein (UPF0280 family)
VGFFYGLEEGMKRHHYETKDTIVTILCDSPHAEAGMKSLARSRDDLEAYIRKHPAFQKTHVPYPLSEDDPEMVRSMIRETARAGVGPMAAVAGAFAEAALRAMLDSGAKEAVVDNGGDIAFSIRNPLRVGIYAGNSPIKNLAFELEPRGGIFGICTSSGTVGPSFSYGKADAAVVVSGNVALADAAATALGNRVEDETDLERCFDFMESIPEIEGALVVYRDKTALWGKLPKLVRSHVDVDLITKGEKRVPGSEF